MKKKKPTLSDCLTLISIELNCINKDLDSNTAEIKKMHDSIAIVGSKILATHSHDQKLLGKIEVLTAENLRLSRENTAFRAERRYKTVRGK